MKSEYKAGLAFLSVVVLVGLLHATGELPDLRDPAMVMASWDTTRFQPGMAKMTQSAEHQEEEEPAIQIGPNGPFMKYSAEHPSYIGNGHWRIPFLSDEMFDSHLIYDGGEQDCKTEWTEKGMRFWCESGMFDVEFEKAD